VTRQRLGASQEALSFGEPVSPLRMHQRLLIVAALLGSASIQAQTIFVCVDAKGATRTSDRPIPECHDREQRVLGRDGTVKRIISPPVTPGAAEQKAGDKCLSAEAVQREPRRPGEDASAPPVTCTVPKLERRPKG